jgi:hypothetical protein
MKISDFFDIYSLQFIVVMLVLWAILYAGFSLAGDADNAAHLVDYLPRFCIELCIINTVRVLILKRTSYK